MVTWTIAITIYIVTMVDIIWQFVYLDGTGWVKHIALLVLPTFSISVLWDLVKSSYYVHPWLLLKERTCGLDRRWLETTEWSIDLNVKGKFMLLLWWKWYSWMINIEQSLVKRLFLWLFHSCITSRKFFLKNVSMVKIGMMTSMHPSIILFWVNST